MTSDVEHLFMWLLFVYLLYKISTQTLCLFFILFYLFSFIFIVIEFEVFIYSGFYLLFIHVICTYFLLVCRMPFNFLIVSFDAQKFLFLLKSNLFTFYFVVWDFCLTSIKLLSEPCPEVPPPLPRFLLQGFYTFSF